MKDTLWELALQASHISGGNTVKLPQSVPGRFFVLRCPNNVFTIYLDDEDRSSHIVGRSVVEVMETLRRMGVDGRLADDAIDRAIECQTVQVIPESYRIIPLWNADTPKLVWEDGKRPSLALLP